MSHTLPSVDELIEGLELPPLTPYQPKRRKSETVAAPDVAFHSEFRQPPSVLPGVILQRGTDVEPQAIEWLWNGWLPRGKFVLLAGQPGTGKTTISNALAATVSIGGSFPDGARCKPGNILIWSGEDDVADTLLPRLIAAGADRARCYFVTASRVDSEIVPFDPARDMLALLSAIEGIGGIDLLVVDPVVSAVTGDSHKNTEVRRSLQPLVDLAAATNAAVLGISHFSKGGQGLDPTQRVIGSVAFAAVARVVMVAAKVQGDEGEDKRVLARSKSNVGPDGGGFEYHLEMTEALPGIEASRVAWGEAVDGSARELLTDPTEDAAGGSANDAVDLLRQCLTGPGWFPAKETNKAMTDAGFTKKQIWSASKKLNVGRKKGAMNDGWYWRMPGGGDRDPEGSPEGSTSTFKESSESSRGKGIFEGSEDSEGSRFLNAESSGESSRVRR